MATETLTTPFAANEDPRKGTYTPTLIASLFSRFLGAIALHIEAERDIQDVDVWDAAFTGWLREAEESLKVVKTFLRQIRDAQVVRASDVPLLRLAILADALIRSADAGDFQRACGLLTHPTLFRCVETGPVGRRVAAMVKTAVLRLDELADLDTYAPDSFPHTPADVVPGSVA
ncbi:hypothetical protein [Pseudotabrizicola alkalilacus]|uniref:Uncharacterized protein n=1 Tax=Pseudotabrizicola alkalilacus TaxID=2305252 RepID=A0A411YWH1_9RHOB|nr:hypothetical protein [Pseudotabrizicola alkalilacus]RGP35196.1 hypothetical protein D1012_21365 [Pseudotabrizicola alkalilacus]